MYAILPVQSLPADHHLAPLYEPSSRTWQLWCVGSRENFWPRELWFRCSDDEIVSWPARLPVEAVIARVESAREEKS